MIHVALGSLAGLGVISEKQALTRLTINPRTATAIASSKEIRTGAKNLWTDS